MIDGVPPCATDSYFCDRPELHSRMTCVVALTRNMGYNQSLQEMLCSAGLTTCEVPCIKFGAGPERGALAPALHERRWQYVLITSPQAAKVFCSEWRNAGCPSVDVASVGKGTSAALQLTHTTVEMGVGTNPDQNAGAGAQHGDQPSDLLRGSTV